MYFSKLSKTILTASTIFLTYTASCNSITDPSPSTTTTTSTNLAISSKLQKVISTKQFRANTPIQDRIAVSELKNVKGILVSVFDGHGGDLCADYLAGNIGKYFQLAFQRKGGFGSMRSPKKFFSEVLEECYDNLEDGFKVIFKQNIANIDYQRVGACALTALVTPRLILVANSGDCQGVFLGGKQPIKTNQRLNAGQPIQQQRLKKQFPNEPDIYKCITNTNYCYVKGRLQPTRSFGDFYLKSQEYNFTKLGTFTGPYITHKPVITAFQMTPQLGKSLVLATDGLWDQLDQTKMSRILSNFHGTNQTAELLFQNALQKILQRNRIKNFENLNKIENRRNLHDDISIVVVDIDKFMKEYQTPGYVYFFWNRNEEEDKDKSQVNK